MPTSAPTSSPTSKPSLFVKEDLLQFDVKVAMSGFPTSTLDDQTQYALILAVATVAKLSTDEVTLSYTATAETLLQYIRRLREVSVEHNRRLVTTYAIDILYTIRTRISAYQDTITPGQSLYQVISSNVQESVSSGNFQQILISSCSSNCSVDFSTIAIKEVVIFSPVGTSESSGKNGIDPVVFAAFAALVIPIVVYLVWKMRLMNFGVIVDYFAASNTTEGSGKVIKVEEIESGVNGSPVKESGIFIDVESDGTGDGANEQDKSNLAINTRCMSDPLQRINSIVHCARNGLDCHTP